jgi:hypothetical protein
MKSQIFYDILTDKPLVFNDVLDLYDHTNAGYTLYDPLKKFVYGRQVNFLADAGANKNDLKKTMDTALGAYASVLLQHGLTDISTPQEQKNGTIVLRQDSTIQTSSRSSTFMVYKIYVNGQIRRARINVRRGTNERFQSHYRITSPKPVLVPNSPFESLCKTYIGSLFAVVGKCAKKQKRT